MAGAALETKREAKYSSLGIITVLKSVEEPG
jgi:hypothetical protein